MNEQILVMVLCVTIYLPIHRTHDNDDFTPANVVHKVYLVMNTNFFRCNSFHLRAHPKVCLTLVVYVYSGVHLRYNKKS